MVVKRHRLKYGKKIIVIPARMDSFRLPGKPMLEADGKPLVQWTYERAKETEADHVIVATGDAEIANHCQKSGMVWMLTTQDHPNGTSRAAEVVSKLKPEILQQVSVVVNWQVDEPMVNLAGVNTLMAIDIASIRTLVSVNRETPSENDDSNTTKVVWSHNRCHWFSRVPMQGAGFHVGLYSFTPFLLQVASRLKPSYLAMLESLEQLTWLENGLTISPVEISRMPLSINTPDDWARFKQLKEGAS